MAHKKSIFIIIFWGLLVLLPTQAEEKFPPISGEIYGQAVPGLKSLLINGKKIPFDQDYNFQAKINLKAGQKYLTLVLNYENLRIIKKYLVLRKAAVKKFKIVVPKEKIEKAIEIAKKPSRQEILRRKRLQQLAALKKKKERERWLKLKEKERIALAEKRWIKSVASPRFIPHEFLLGPSPEALASAIENDQYGFSLRAKAKTIAWLNQILEIPNFYELVVLKGKKIILTPRLKKLIAETESYRSKPFATLSLYQKKKIMFLNRLLLEALYPQTPQKKSWLITEEKVSPIPKTCEYLYVWEFSEGKLLLVKETKGSYSAEIHIPVAKEWLDLKGISSKELKEIIGKPIAIFRQTKKK